MDFKSLNISLCKKTGLFVIPSHNYFDLWFWLNFDIIALFDRNSIYHILLYSMVYILGCRDFTIFFLSILCVPTRYFIFLNGIWGFTRFCQCQEQCRTSDHGRIGRMYLLFHDVQYYDSDVTQRVTDLEQGTWISSSMIALC